MARISKDEREQVRRRLLDSAAAHFSMHGLHGANINRISVDAGYARGTVYNYFSSKEELFSAVLAVGSALTVSRYRARKVQGGLSVHLMALVEEDIQLVRHHQDIMKVFVRELVAPRDDTRQHVEASLQPLLTLVLELVGHAQAQGELRSDLSAEQLAQLFLGQLTMAYVGNWTTQGQWPSWEEIPALVVSMFLDGAQAAGFASGDSPGQSNVER
jgi:AcrR family transcriptional regulator